MFLLTTIGNVTWIVYQFKDFGGKGCPLNDILMIVTCIFGVLIHVLVCFTPREDASILTSSLVLSYNVYLQWAAFSSLPDETCNPYF